MALSDSQLMLLEQVTYANKDLFNALGVPYSSPVQVLEKIKTMSYDDIYALSKVESINNHTMSGQEWADILCAIKSDPDIMDLKCVSYSDKAKGYCYVSSNGEAYVTFRGTDGADEWKDDAEGLGMSDTPCQKWALDYIEGLPYDNITVAGHSKGGNKAQYVTITSDKVNRCVSMDGQGFSKEFIDKYWAEIEKKGNLIKNYSYKSDFVHILMNYIPGSQQIYCDGENTGAECHNPNGMISIEYDKKNKKWNVSYKETAENPSMTYLHEFTCFVANNMPIEDRQKIGEYLGMLLAIALAGGTYFINGKKYDKSNILDFIKSDPDSASTVIAWLMKYIEVYHLSKSDALALMEAMGITGLEAEAIWKIIDLQDLDGEHDFGYYLNIIGRIKRELRITALDGLFFDSILTNAKIKRNQIKVDKKTARNDHQSRTDKKRDFSANSLNTINSAINSINSNTFDNSSSWTAFAGEEWYSSISAGIALHGINKYFEKLYSVNSRSKTQINNIYQSVRSLDNACSRKIQNQVNIMDGHKANITGLCDSIG